MVLNQQALNEADQYFEELKRGPNAELGVKDIFEITSNIPVQT
jgi:hypothetical protein